MIFNDIPSLQIVITKR